VHERVGILELSSFAKFDVSGPDAESFLNRVFANRMATRKGGIKLAHLLNEAGRIQTEATITRISDERFYILSGAAWEVKDFDALIHSIRADERVEIENVTDHWGNLIVVGPRARDLLSRLTDADLSNDSFPWLTAQEIEIARVPCRALRVNYVGELGWELHHPMQRMPELYDAIWQAGRDLGIADFGAYAVNSLRIEKGYRGIGAEMTNEISPIEAGLQRFVDMKKGNFVGREALEQIERAGITQQLVYLEVDASNADCLGGEPIYFDGEVVGVTTSGGFGHRTQKSLAFGYVAPRFAEVGTKIEIEILEERRSATVLDPDPTFDPKNERLRS
jgi:dimethylglycine dehydrogenase